MPAFGDGTEPDGHLLDYKGHGEGQRNERQEEANAIGCIRGSLLRTMFLHFICRPNEGSKWSTI